MTRVERATRATFRSLRSRNYRLYFAGQIVSVSGTWMQGVAQGWLVLQLTGSGTWLGLVTGLQFLPMLLAGPFGGLVADRVDKRRLMIITQSVMAVLAVILGVLVATGLIQLWMVLLLAFAFGCVVAIDNPTRQSFVLEMVGTEDLPNAVTLNTVVINAARAVGPAVGGVLIATVGLAACFLLNGVSYLAVIVALYRMRPAELHLSKRAPRGPKQLREGLRYVWSTPELRIPLLVMAAVGTLTYEFHVTLPLLAKFTFGGNALTYGLLSSVMGIGAVIGGLASARKSEASVAALLRATWVFGGLVLLLAFAPNLPLAIVAILLVGAASIRFMSIANAALQLGAAPHMRGRVMALWGVAFMGSTPLGGPAIGLVAQAWGAPAGLAVGAFAAMAAAAVGQRALRRARPTLGSPVEAELQPAAGVAVGLSKRWRRLATASTPLVSVRRRAGAAGRHPAPSRRPRAAHSVGHQDWVHRR